MAKVGFIGTGVMGAAMAGHLLAAGHELTVYNRTKSKADVLISRGAVWEETPCKVAENVDFLFSMVGYPADVEEIYFGEVGIFSADLAGKVLVDMTTSTPSLAVKIAEKARDAGAWVLDAPVSGGDIGAKEAQLTIMVGGEETVYRKVLPLFQVIGKTIVHQGKAGNGQHTKMVNQIGIAGTMTALSELLVYAKASGLDLEMVLDTLKGGGAATWSLTNYAPRILKEDYSPGFFVKHFVKDLQIVLEEAKKLNLSLPATEQAEKLYEKLAAEGYENAGVQSLVKLWWG